MPKQSRQDKKRKNTRKGDLEEGLPELNRNAAGIDVGSAEHYVAVPLGRDAEPVRSFGSFTADLHRMAQWLKACGIQTVVMQATGVYWVALFQILEDYGLKVNVVNARHTKTLPGRKTDVLECQWLQKPHTFGLLNNSFRPAQDIRVLRTYLRQRENLVAAASKCIQHMQKSPYANESAASQCDQRYQWSNRVGDSARDRRRRARSKQAVHFKEQQHSRQP